MLPSSAQLSSWKWIKRKRRNRYRKPRGMIKPMIRVTKQDKQDQYGCELLLVELIENGTTVHKLTAVSGQPWAQVFRHCTDRGAHAGSCEPIPQGWYDGEKVVWAEDEPWARQRSPRTSRWVYNEGIGEWCSPLRPRVVMERGNFLFHMDYNRSGSPGSGGCVTFIYPDHGASYIKWRQQGPELVPVEIQWKLK